MNYLKMKYASNLKKKKTTSISEGCPVHIGYTWACSSWAFSLCAIELIIIETSIVC